jgi:hypothetical protein
MGGEFGSSRFSALRAAQLTERNCCWVLAGVGRFQRRAVHVFAYRLLYDPEGIHREIVFLARAFRHTSSLPFATRSAILSYFKLTHYRALN